MFQEFKNYLHQHSWQGKIIVGVSGGADSMVLAYLLKKCNVQIVLAHFNYGLRGEESDADQQFVETWAQENEIEFYTKKMDLGAHLEAEGGNLQEEARKWRYEWMEALREELDYDWIAVAHHQEDVVETVFMNFLKGTGIAGLHGILPQQGFIIRPLLSFKKGDILNYAQEEKIDWRMDSSNLSNKYLRNQLRNQIIPELKTLVPQLEENLIANVQRWQEVEMLYSESIERYRRRLIEQRGKDWYIPILKLKNCRPLKTILYELLLPFGFSASQLSEVMKLLDAGSGKMVLAKDYRVLRDRNFLIITNNETIESHHILIHENPRKERIVNSFFDLEKNIKSSISQREWTQIEKAGREDAFLDLKSIEFPLILRPWRQGDYFYPFGMGMKKKKISRFLIDQKVPLHQKEEVWVVESQKKIIWVVGFRIDERFKMTSKTKDYMHLKVHKNEKMW